VDYGAYSSNTTFEPRQKDLLSARDVIRKAQEDWDSIDGESENKNPRILKEKQEILRNLHRRMGGPAVTREQGFTMKTPLIELQFADTNKTEDDAEDDAIVSAKEWAKIIFSAIEGGNQRFGPILELKGWSAHLGEEIERFDRPFRQIYRRFFAKRASNPGMEIAWIVFGSALMFHFTGKLSGGTKKPTPSRDHSGAHRAARSARGQSYKEEDEFDHDEELPPPPGNVNTQFKKSDRTVPQQGAGGRTGPDIAALLGGMLGGGTSVPGGGMSGLNLGNILGMLGGGGNI
jgi:hypothetical protein